MWKVKIPKFDYFRQVVNIGVRRRRDVEYCIKTLREVFEDKKSHPLRPRAGAGSGKGASRSREAPICRGVEKEEREKKIKKKKKKL